MNFKLNKVLITGGIALLITINLYNILNFVFRWTMVRMLDINDYRKLAVIISLIYLIAIFTESIQIIIARYTSIHPENGEIKNIFKRTIRKSLLVSTFAFIAYLFISIPLSSLVKIEYSILAVNGILIFPLLLAPIVRGILQGRKQFVAFGSSLVIEGFFKVAIAVLLVYIGLAVYGSLIAIISGVLLSFLFTLISIKDILVAKEKRAEAINIYNYSIPVFVINAIILIYLSIDVILSSIIFSEELAGQYAIASLVAQTIFIVTSPISKAMFPISSNNSEKQKSNHNVIINASLFLVSLLIIGLILVYAIPDLLIYIISGKSSELASNIVFNLSIGFSILSLANLTMIYKLSLGKIQKKGFNLFVALTGLISIAFMLVIAFFRNITPYQFSYLFISIMGILLILSLVFLKKEKDNNL